MSGTLSFFMITEGRFSMRKKRQNLFTSHLVNQPILSTVKFYDGNAIYIGPKHSEAAEC